MNYFLIDALNLAYRAHNANYELKTGSGLFSGMFYGFIRTIFALKKKYRGYKFEVVWDRTPEHKKALQQDYKAGRSGLSDTVFGQVADIQCFLENSGVDQYYMPSQEADDVIATLTEGYLSDPGTTIIYSNDKDLLQLVKNGKVVVYKPKVAANPEKFYDEEAVIEQFGVSPDKLACYRSFDGDPSDNITGINRVPRKIIASMVNEYLTIDKIYENLPGMKLTDFQRGSMLEGKDRVATNLKIVALNKNLDAIVCTKGKFDKNRLVELFKKYDIKSIKPENIVDIFSSSLNVKYSDPREVVKVESFSLFD
jgi:DNA polymerase I